MTVREFDGVDDVIRLNVGSALGITQSGDVTILSIVKNGNSSNARGSPFWMGPVGSNDTALSVETFNDGWSFLDSNDEFVEASATLVQDVWVLAGFSRDATTGTVRFHEYNYNTDTWSHSDVGSVSTPPDAGGAAEVLCIGRWSDLDDDYSDGRFAVSGVFGSVLSDGDIESGLETRLSNWFDHGPDAVWAFNQDATTENVVDLTGNGADQTSITGTTAVTGDDPPGFNFDVGELPFPPLVMQPVVPAV